MCGKLVLSLQFKFYNFKQIFVLVSLILVYFALNTHLYYIKFNISV